MLSLSMIVRNEEARLAGCLESVRGFVDEIVVVVSIVEAKVATFGGCWHCGTGEYNVEGIIEAL